MTTEATMAIAGIRQPTVRGNLKPLGYVQATITTATGLTVPTDTDPVTAFIQAQDNNVRYRDDATSPDTTTGVILYAGDGFWYDGDLGEIEFVSESGTAKLNILYYGY